jgi:hypothetical protein
MPAHSSGITAAQDGRDGNTKDGAIIVNETFAKAFWPKGESPVGKRIRNSDKAPWMTVVGYVADVKHYGLEQPMRPGVHYALPRIPQSPSLECRPRASARQARMREWSLPFSQGFRTVVLHDGSSRSFCAGWRSEFRHKRRGRIGSRRLRPRLPTDTTGPRPSRS